MSIEGQDDSCLSCRMKKGDPQSLGVETDLFLVEHGHFTGQDFTFTHFQMALTVDLFAAANPSVQTSPVFMSASSWTAP